MDVPVMTCEDAVRADVNKALGRAEALADVLGRLLHWHDFVWGGGSDFQAWQDARDLLDGREVAQFSGKES